MPSMAAYGQAESLARWSAPRDSLIGQSYACDLESLATGARMAGIRWPQSLCQWRLLAGRGLSGAGDSRFSAYGVTFDATSVPAGRPQLSTSTATAATIAVWCDG